MLPVGVFRDCAAATIVADIATMLNLHAVQLHGEEDADYVRVAAARAARDVRDLDRGQRRPRSRWQRRGGDRLLFDNGDGGSGRTLRLVADREPPRAAASHASPAGSAPHNARAARALGAYAIDVGSAVDAEPGREVARKDRRLVRRAAPGLAASGCAQCA